MWMLDEGIAEPETPSEHDDLLLGEGTLYELTDLVRQTRALLREERDPEVRRSLGRQLYDLQGALRARFKVDIAKVR